MTLIAFKCTQNACCKYTTFFLQSLVINICGKCIVSTNVYKGNKHLGVFTSALRKKKCSALLVYKIRKCAQQNMFISKLMILVKMYGPVANPNGSTVNLKYWASPTYNHEKPKNC